ncbi:MAG TPA: NADH-quinone oxidoreductase subunit J [Acidimicrobiales bacterium]|nr:NADH-quinone oxidoreductase subunit J [Acidimicrobiales bacterium]
MTKVLAVATIPDAITFAIAAAICVVGAFGVVLARNPVHSALMLVMTLFGVAVLFVEENAQFLAAVQVIVYAGAIVVLFLFVIMLLGVDRSEAIERDPLPGQRFIAVCLGILGLAEVLLLAHGQWPRGARSVSGAQGSPADNVRLLGRSVFTTYLLAFEVTSALLVIAVVGAVVLARRPRRALGDAIPPGADEPLDGSPVADAGGEDAGGEDAGADVADVAVTGADVAVRREAEPQAVDPEAIDAEVTRP